MKSEFETFGVSEGIGGGEFAGGMQDIDMNDGKGGSLLDIELERDVAAAKSDVEGSFMNKKADSMV